MNPLTCYIELFLEPFFINRSLIRNIIASILTIKYTWYFWQMPKLLKKESQYTYYHNAYYHNALEYVSLILRIKQWYYAENFHKIPEREHLLYYIDYYKGIWVAHLMILVNYSQNNKRPEKSPKMYYILIRRQITAIPIPELLEMFSFLVFILLVRFSSFVKL